MKLFQRKPKLDRVQQIRSGRGKAPLSTEEVIANLDLTEAVDLLAHAVFDNFDEVPEEYHWQMRQRALDALLPALPSLVEQVRKVK